MTTIALDRRQFLVMTALAGGGMAFAVLDPTKAAADAATADAATAAAAPSTASVPLAHGLLPVNPKPWLPPVEGGVEVTPWFVISADNYITARISQTELGQGVFTSNAMMFCEELEADWTKMRVVYADANRQVATHVYDTRDRGGMGTSASGSVRDGRAVYQQAGATAREQLRLAAAQQWDVPVGTVEAKNSVLTHRPSGRTLTYGAVAARAATITLPREPRIKRPDQYATIIGQRVKMLDLELKAYGQAVYGIDVRLPNMVYAAVKCCPVFGGKLKSFNFEAVKGRPGVHSAVPLTGHGLRMEGVAIVADSWWRAKTAVDALPVEWDEGPNAARGSSADFFAEFRSKFTETGLFAFDEGDVTAALAAGGAKTLDVEYQMPYQSHTPMEPMSCTAQFTDDRIDVWAGSGGPDGLLQTVARAADMPTEKVFVYNAFSGGSFGDGRPRQAAVHAVLIAKTLNGRPVKVLWTREQDIAMDAYRQSQVTRCRGVVDAAGIPTAASYHVVTDQEPTRGDDGPGVPVGRRGVVMDREASWGYSALPYWIDNQRAEVTTLSTSIPVQSWRAPGHVNAAFVIESFTDELAHAAGQDPYQFRRALLVKNPGTDPGFRHKDAWIKALDIVAEKSNWGTPLPRGAGRGIAIDDRRKHFSTLAQRNYGDHTLIGISATVAEVTVSKDGVLKVTRVVVVHDMGDGLINPEAVERQIRGQFAWAMSAGIHHEITTDRGRVVQTNFNNYPMVRMADFPAKIDIYEFKGFEQIAGAGEEVIPSIIPAICNAIFAATGKRLRTLPIKHSDLSWT